MVDPAMEENVAYREIEILRVGSAAPV